MKVKTILLICGIASSVLYILMDLIAVVSWSGYQYSSQTVSELFAVDAPVRTFVIISFILYAFLIYAFGAGVWLCAREKKSLKVAAILIIGKEVLGLACTLVFPIHLRGVEGNYSDIMHGILTAAGVFLCMFPAMIAGSVAFKGIFRVYSIVTMILFIVFGIAAGSMQPGYTANLPTPMMGIWERINIYGYLLWIAIFSIMILRMEDKQPD